MKGPYDLIGFGNAIVDVIAEAGDAFLNEHDIPKGGMILIDEDRAQRIYGAMAPGVEISGGSNANAIACAASLGARAAFVGKVADDPLGEIFAHDLAATGVAFETPRLKGGPGTGRCLITVTPDAQRSMATFLGAAGHVAPSDIDADAIEASEIAFFEGYLFEQDGARDAFVKACEIARAKGKRTAITLSDVGVIERQRAALALFVHTHIDILLANEHEAQALFGARDGEDLAQAARAAAPLVAVTQSEKGSVLIPRDGDLVEIGARPADALKDTTGAGDAYAGGLLFGLAKDLSLADAGAMGSLAASEVISHFGARPEAALDDLARDAGLL